MRLMMTVNRFLGRGKHWLMDALALAPQVPRDQARRAAASGSTRKRRNAGSGNLGCQPRRGSAAFARARRCGSLVQNDCTAVTVSCSHAKAARARVRPLTSVSLALLLPLAMLSGCLATTEHQPGESASAERPDSLVVAEENWQALDIMILARTTPDFDFRQGPAPFRRDIEGNLVRNTPRDGEEWLEYCDLYLHDLTDLPGHVSRAGGADPYVLHEVFDQWGRTHPPLAVRSVYRANGVTNLDSVVFEALDDFLNPEDREVRLRHDCSGTQSELMVAPRYLYEPILELPAYKRFARYEILAYWSFSRLRDASMAMDERRGDRDAQAEVRSERYTLLAAENARETVGSLFFSWNRRHKSFAADDRRRTGDGFYRQNVCALSTSGHDAMAIRGYRSLGEDMLSEALASDFSEWERYSPAHLLLEPEDIMGFEKVYDSLDDLYKDADAQLAALSERGWRSEGSCNIFVGFPADIVKLQTALEQRGHSQPEVHLGQLVEVEELWERYATRSGYESYAELDFVLNWPEDISHGQLAILRDRGYNREPAYSQLREEILQSGYLTEADLSVAGAVQYLKDSDEAREQGVTVLQAREQRRLEAQRRAEQEARRRQAAQTRLQREYPFYAVLSCGLQGSHTAIAACFNGGRMASATTLELENGDDYRMYAFHELDRAGREGRAGLNIPLRETFRIQAQNSSPNLLLTLTVYERATGNTVFRRSAQQYGVLSVRNE